MIYCNPHLPTGYVRLSTRPDGVFRADGEKTGKYILIYKAVDTVAETGLFHFHEAPNPLCDIGRNIHAALDDKIEKVQATMEEELRQISMADVLADLTSAMAAEK